MKRTQIYLPGQQIKELQIQAKRTDTNVSAIIRGLLATYLEPPKTAPKRQTSLLAAARQINSKGKRAGPRNLAANIDKCSYGK